MDVTCLVEEKTNVGNLNSLLEVSIFENDQRRLATKLERNVFQVALAAGNLIGENVVICLLLLCMGEYSRLLRSVRT